MRAAHLVAMDATGDMIAIGADLVPGNADGGMVAVWKTRGWPPRFASEPLVVVRTKYANVDSIAFSPDGERLIRALKLSRRSTRQPGSLEYKRRQLFSLVCARSRGGSTFGSLSLRRQATGNC